MTGWNGPAAGDPLAGWGVIPAPLVPRPAPEDGVMTERNRDRLAAVMRGFPGWRVGRSDAGRLWATRTGRNRSRPRGAAAEWAMTVDADDAAGLRETLTRQQQAGPV
jgi:hypothetical protein